MLVHIRQFFTQFAANLEHIAIVCILMSQSTPTATHICSAMCREPLRHSKALPLSWNGSSSFSAGVTQPSLLLWAHVPNLLSLFASAFRLCALSLCRLLQAPADNRPFPTLSLSIFPKMSDSLSRCSLRCMFSFLPLKHRPSPVLQGIGKTQFLYSNFSTEVYIGIASILLCSNLFVCSPPWLLAL